MDKQIIKEIKEKLKELEEEYREEAFRKIDVLRELKARITGK